MQRFVGLKIQKSAAEFSQSAMNEIEFLSAISKSDPSASGTKSDNCVIQLLDHFKHVGPNGQHICIVMEVLGDSLLRLIRYRNYKGIGLNQVKEICRSILTGLDYLHTDIGVIHTDLKLENLLLVSTINPANDPIRSGFAPILQRPNNDENQNKITSSITNLVERKLMLRARRAKASLAAAANGTSPSMEEEARSLEGIDLRCKIADFGNACWANRRLMDEIQTREYRAPEVILASGYSFSADMWSFACIAFELATGHTLFAPKPGQGYSEDEDHLALMIELLGRIPKKVFIAFLPKLNTIFNYSFTCCSALLYMYLDCCWRCSIQGLV